MWSQVRVLPLTPRRKAHLGDVAQMVEQVPEEHRVVGSIPTVTTAGRVVLDPSRPHKPAHAGATRLPLPLGRLWDMCPMNDTSSCEACGRPVELTKRSTGYSYRRRRFCAGCGALKKLGGKDPVHTLTKGALFAKRSSWQSARTALRKHAESVYIKSDLPKCCVVCGYSKHFDVAHRRPVSDFQDSALVSEINDLSNLVALCKNHHWEYDTRSMDPTDLAKVIVLSEHEQVHIVREARGSGTGNKPLLLR